MDWFITEKCYHNLGSIYSFTFIEGSAAFLGVERGSTDINIYEPLRLINRIHDMGLVNNKVAFFSLL